MKNNIVATNADRIIGKHLYLTKEITSTSWGELTCNGVVWNVTSLNNENIPANALVEVLKIEGSKLVVKEVKE